jgi:hypothetical protein
MHFHYGTSHVQCNRVIRQDDSTLLTSCKTSFTTHSHYDPRWCIAIIIRQVAPRWLKPYTISRVIMDSKQMVSCMVSAAWSCPILSLYCTEHDPSRGVILSDHITTVDMSISDQLGQRCTIGTHCSGMHVYRRFSNARACLGNTRA